MPSQRRRNARRSTSNLRRIALPLAGLAAVLVVVVLVITIVASGSDGNDGDEGSAVVPDQTGAATVDTPPSETEESAPTPTPEVAESDEDPSPTPAPTASGDAVESPTSEPTPQPTPTPEPLVGDFGELPPGDMPSGSPAESLDLEFLLDISLQSIPSQAPAYQLRPREWTLEETQQLGNRLGMDGEVVDQGNQSFQLETERASLYVSTSTVQYIRRPTDDESPALPGDEQVRQMARSWLVDTGLVGADMGPAEVLDRDEERNLAFVIVKPVEPADIISATPSAGVTVRGDGVVTEAMVNWPRSLVASNYGLRGPEAMWQDARQARGFIDIDPDRLPADFSGATGTVTITDAGVAYTIAGSPMTAQYLVPVVVFSGTVTVDGAEEPIPVQVYVQAVSAQSSPRG